jgi:hypothetical protein
MRVRKRTGNSKQRGKRKRRVGVKIYAKGWVSVVLGAVQTLQVEGGRYGKILKLFISESVILLHCLELGWVLR